MKYKEFLDIKNNVKGKILKHFNKDFKLKKFVLNNLRGQTIMFMIINLNKKYFFLIKNNS